MPDPEGQLPTTIRGYTAFVFGHRLLQLKQPKCAAKLFRVAVEDSGADIVLRMQAEEERKRSAAAVP